MKKVLILLTAFAVLACGTGSDSRTDAPSATTEHADRLYFNGVIWTGSDAAGDATVMAITNGVISYVGSEGNPRIVPEETIDLQGRFVMPGFIDNHVHFLEGGAALAGLDLRDAEAPEVFSQGASPPCVESGRERR